MNSDETPPSEDYARGYCDAVASLANTLKGTSRMWIAVDQFNASGNLTRAAGDAALSIFRECGLVAHNQKRVCYPTCKQYIDDPTPDYPTQTRCPVCGETVPF